MKRFFTKYQNLCVFIFLYLLMQFGSFYQFLFGWNDIPDLIFGFGLFGIGFYGCLIAALYSVLVLFSKRNRKACITFIIISSVIVIQYFMVSSASTRDQLIAVSYFYHKQSLHLLTDSVKKTDFSEQLLNKSFNNGYKCLYYNIPDTVNDIETCELYFNEDGSLSHILFRIKNVKDGFLFFPAHPALSKFLQERHFREISVSKNWSYLQAEGS